MKATGCEPSPVTTLERGSEVEHLRGICARVGCSGYSPLALYRGYLAPAGWACQISKQGGTTSIRCPRPCEQAAFLVQKGVLPECCPTVTTSRKPSRAWLVSGPTATCMLTRQTRPAPSTPSTRHR